ncbi:MAG: glutamine-hydrolyzing carbamoyl-phosphate synthase small subunit [Bacteroidetes bacterium]|nr:glutamine-hydrolyzing carbamoyl-phosphate synthase small subunit [Bacteroidota bacterium]
MITTKIIEDRNAILLLEDGKIFHGKAAGKIGSVTGELCFNTGMTGYQEVFTDPSYFGQLLIATNPHIGNYGIKLDENQSGSIKISGLICKVFNEHFSRKMADESIQQFFLDNNITAISHVDTRALVSYIRSKGVMNAVISSEETDLDVLKQMLAKTPSMAGLELSSQVTAGEAYHLGNPDGKYKVAVMDFGVKQRILDNFISRDCYLKVFPAKASFDEVEAWNPDGYFLSNGPGDPSAMPYAVETATQMLTKDKPLFGICLGHQIFAQALGIHTYKMHNGHRGLNHPVKNLKTGLCEITSQNHGFSVKMEDVKNNADVELTHINLNDDTVEGIRHKTKKAFSVQYHPEAAPGPNDANYLFDDFVKVIADSKKG